MGRVQGAVGSGTGATVTATLGTASQVGSTLLAYIADYDSDTAMTMPTGWVIVPGSTCAYAGYGVWSAWAIYNNNPGGITSVAASGASGNAKAIILSEWTGYAAASGVPDASGENPGGSGTAVTVSTGAATTAANDLTMAGFIFDGSATSDFTKESTYTLDNAVVTGGGVAATEYLTTNSAAIQTATGTLSFSSGGYGASIISLKASGGATTAYASVPGRFRLAGQGHEDVPGRFRMMATNWAGVSGRFRMSVAAHKDVSGRFRVLGGGYASVAGRFRLMSPYSYESIAGRFRIMAQNWASAPGRFRLMVQGHEDIAGRFRLAVANYASVPGRFRLLSRGFSDRAGRFQLAIAGHADVAGRMRLMGRGYGSYPGRFLLQGPSSIFFRALTQAGFANTTSVSGTLPSGTVSTDVLFAWVYWDGATAPDVPAAPSGWHLIGSTYNGGLSGALYWALGTASAPTFDFASSGTPTSCYNGLEIAGYEGVDTTTPYVTADFAVVWGASGTGSPVSTLPVQVQNGNWFVCGFAPYSVSNQTYSAPSGLTARQGTSPLAWFDSNGAAPGANVVASSTSSYSGTFVGFALSLNPSGGGSGAPVAEATLIGQSLAFTGASPTISNSLEAIPAGTYLRLRVSDTGYGGTAGFATDVAGGSLDWTQLHDSGDVANGSNHIRQSVWGALAPDPIAKSALTLTVSHTAGASAPNSSMDLVMITDSAGVDVSAYDDSVETAVNQDGGIAVTGAQSGDLLLGAIMGYATDSGGDPVASGKLQTLIGLSTPTTNPPVQTWIALDGPTGSGTSEVEICWGNTNGALAPYVAWAEAFLPTTGGSNTADVQGRFRMVGQTFEDVPGRFRMVAGADRDVAGRFRMAVAAFESASGRFRLAVANWASTPGRFRLMVGNWAGTPGRFRLMATNHADVGGRFRLVTAGTFRDASGRFRMLANGVQSAAGRFRLAVGAFRDVPGRFRLAVANHADVSGRFRLANPGNFRDVAGRFRIMATNWAAVPGRFVMAVGRHADVAGRFRLAGGGHADAPGRFRLRTGSTYADAPGLARLAVANHADVGGRARIRAGAYASIGGLFQLAVRGYGDVAGRFGLALPHYADVQGRFRLSAAASSDVGGRFGLKIPGVSEPVGQPGVVSIPGVNPVANPGNTVTLLAGAATVNIPEN